MTILPTVLDRLYLEAYGHARRLLSSDAVDPYWIMVETVKRAIVTAALDHSRLFDTEGKRNEVIAAEALRISRNTVRANRGVRAGADRSRGGPRNQGGSDGKEEGK